MHGRLYIYSDIKRYHTSPAITQVSYEELGISNYIHVHIIGKRIIVLCKKPVIDE